MGFLKDCSINGQIDVNKNDINWLKHEFKDVELWVKDEMKEIKGWLKAFVLLMLGQALTVFGTLLYFLIAKGGL